MHFSHAWASVGRMVMVGQLSVGTMTLSLLLHTQQALSAFFSPSKMSGANHRDPHPPDTLLRQDAAGAHQDCKHCCCIPHAPNGLLPGPHGACRSQAWNCTAAVLLLCEHVPGAARQAEGINMKADKR